MEKGYALPPDMGVPRNVTDGPHLFIQEGGRLLPITPVLSPEQAQRLGEVLEGVMGRYLGEG